MALGGCGLCSRTAALLGFGQDLLDPRRILVDVLNIIVVDLHHGVFVFDRGNDNRHSLLSSVVSFSIPDPRIKNVSPRETHFDGERQNPHSCVVRIGRFTFFLRRRTDGGGAGRSVGMFRASLHVYGGTFDSVTCHQRRYHYPRLRIVALSPAIGCMQRRCCSLCLDHFTSRSIGILAHPLPGSPQAERICLPYSVFRRISWDFPLYTTKTKKRSKKTKIRKRSQKLRKRNRFRQDLPSLLREV